MWHRSQCCGVKWGCACVAREVSVERGGIGERGCARRFGGWVGGWVVGCGRIIAMDSAAWQGFDPEGNLRVAIPSRNERNELT